MINSDRALDDGLGTRIPESSRGRPWSTTIHLYFNGESL